MNANTKKRSDGIRSTVVEWATHMPMYATLSPTSVNHREELI